VEEILLGFGPTLLIVGIFVVIARRMAKSGGGWAHSASSAARERGAWTRRRSG